MAELNATVNSGATLSVTLTMATLTGANGLSAYEIAVKNGYVGTEVQWLASLKGKDGVDGKDGPQGIQGDKGDTGLQGPKGDKGDKGDAGKDGASVKLTTINTTITAASWSNGSYSISNESITANSLVYLSPEATTTKEMFEAMAAAEIIVIPADGSVAIKALGTVPTIDIIANVVTVGV